MSVQGDFITVPELQANGCLTGDCPHNSASDCIDHLTLMIGMLRDSAGEEDAGPRAYLPPVVVTRIQNFLDGHPADDSIIKLADAKGRPFTHVTAGWLRSILRTDQTPHGEAVSKCTASQSGKHEPDDSGHFCRWCSDELPGSAEVTEGEAVAKLRDLAHRMRGIRYATYSQEITAIADELAALRDPASEGEAVDERIVRHPNGHLMVERVPAWVPTEEQTSEALRSLGKAWPYLADHAPHIDGEFNTAHGNLTRYIERFRELLATHPAPASEGEAWNAALEWVAGMLDTENDWAGASAFAMTVRAGRKRLRWDVDVDYMAGGLCTATVSVEAHNADEAAETAVAVVLETRESTSVRNAVARLATHPAPATVTEDAQLAIEDAMAERIIAKAGLDPNDCDDDSSDAADQIATGIRQMRERLEEAAAPATVTEARTEWEISHGKAKRSARVAFSEEERDRVVTYLRDQVGAHGIRVMERVVCPERLISERDVTAALGGAR